VATTRSFRRGSGKVNSRISPTIQPNQFEEDARRAGFQRIQGWFWNISEEFFEQNGYMAAYTRGGLIYHFMHVEDILGKPWPEGRKPFNKPPADVEFWEQRRKWWCEKLGKPYEEYPPEPLL
jgi:hypothetical protein